MAACCRGDWISSEFIWFRVFGMMFIPVGMKMAEPACDVGFKKNTIPAKSMLSSMLLSDADGDFCSIRLSRNIALDCP